MLRLLIIFYKAQPFAWALTLALLLGTSTASAQSCNPSPIYAFTQAVYFEQYIKAQGLLARVTKEHSFEMAQFLGQVLNWKQAYDADDSSAQNDAIDQVESHIKSLTAQLTQRQDIAFMSDAGNIMLHAARIHLVMGYVLRAAKRAKQGNEILLKVVDTEPQYPDAILSLGLYQFYTDVTQSNFNWVGGLFSFKGNAELGLEKVRLAIDASPHYAFEAMRSLLMESSWQKESICRHPDILLSAEAIEIKSIEVFQRAINVQLYCGRADRAMSIIDLVAAQSKVGGLDLNLDQQTWMTHARLHGLAIASEVNVLRNLIERTSPTAPDHLYEYAQFSLAKALDVQGKHAEAKVLYQKVAASSLEPSYRALAKQYQRFGFQKPQKYEPVTSQWLIKTCQ